MKNTLQFSPLRRNLRFSAMLFGSALFSPLSLQAAQQKMLLAPLEMGDEIGVGGWKLSNAGVEAADIAPKFGTVALRFRGVAEDAGAKGDFRIANYVPGQCQSLSLWANLPEAANVASIGLQIHDAQGEVLLSQIPANWTGWKQLTWDIGKTQWAQAYAQADKNKQVDQPIQSVHLVWFSKSAGPSSLVVDALEATTELEGKSDVPLQIAWSGAQFGAPGKNLRAQVLLTNFSNAALSPTIEYSIQRDPAYYSNTPPDPIWGSDHALGAKSWTEIDGQKIEDNSLTDGKAWTSTGTNWGQHQEAYQFVDLGQERRVSHLSFNSGDANWTWKVDIEASRDGKDYQPIEGLQNLDWHGKWGQNAVRISTPSNARFLRLRHHNGGEVVNQIKMPSSLSVYDGVADEKWQFPNVGETIGEGKLSPVVAARAFEGVPIESAKPLSPGAYLIAMKIEAGGQTQLVNAHYLVEPPLLDAVSPASRFGLNTAQIELAPLHRRLGIGWVRFENMKWPMISPEPNLYKFDGSVAPWVVPHDKMVEAFAKEGISFLPFLFLTPDYATSAPANIDKNRCGSYPPKDNAQWADFVFQTVARYGAAKHPANVLKTPDKKSGLNTIHVWELWNEPNLTAPSWGPWVGTQAQYLDLFRAGAEAAKRADPTAQVTNGGYAGLEVETVDALRTKYLDGKMPLDWVDILNVHYYSGQTAPEIATIDTNVDRSGKTAGGRTYEDALKRLSAWRDEYKPKMPIWLTETGYDTGGPYGVSEQLQAARLPRVIMMALANGIEKVFVYRESGSTPGQHAASGLLRNDGSRKPSWFSYATLIRQLDGATNGRRLPHPDANVRLYQWTRGKETILSAWTIEGEAKLALPIGTCRATDSFGHTRDEKDGAQMQLSIFPTYISAISNAATIRNLEAKVQQEEKAQADERARLSKTKAYLFDFGSDDKIGTIDIGNTRRFTPVLAKDIYDDARGFGFSRPALGDTVANWIDDALERDACRIDKDTAFQVRAQPGRYTVRIGAEPFGDAAKITIKGANGGEQTLDISKAKPSADATIEVGAQPLVIAFDNYVSLRWISLIAQ